MEQQLPRKYPLPINTQALKAHFADKYQFNEEQVELMLQSSRESLQAILVRAHHATDGEQLDFEEIARIGHSLKGLFLNLGEAEWAGVAREMEEGAKQKDIDNYLEMVEGIRQGVLEILHYGEE